MIIKDKRTNEEIDTGKKNPRLTKMVKRIYAFSTAMEKLEEERPFDLKMVTLTYKYVGDWDANHIRDYLRALRRYPDLKNKLLGYAWVAELQKRGAVHYHMYCAVEPGIQIPRPDDTGMWSHGMSRVERGRSVFYISSYTSKEYQKEGPFPRGLRMYAVWFQKDLLTEYDYWIFKLSAYPKWMVDEILKKDDFYCPEIPKRREGGGWKIKHPASVKNHDVWVPIFSPYEIIRYTSPSEAVRTFGRENA